MILSVFTVNTVNRYGAYTVCAVYHCVCSRRAVANDAAFTRCCVPLCLHVDTDKLFGRLKGGQGVLQGMITQEAIAGDPWYWKEHACSAGLQGTLGVR